MPIIGGRQVGVRGLGFQGAGKPNQVTGLTATDFGTSRAFNDGRIDLSWTAPSDNGAPITGYRIERSTDNVSYSAISVNTGTTATSYSDTGLNSNQIYYYKVAAINAVDTGPLSTAANATSTTVPQAPTVSAANVGTGRAYNNGAATVTVSGGATGGKAISSYTATSSPGSFTATSGSPLTVTGLQSATAYTFSVTATNANGTSTATVSNSITATTVPQAPTIGTATDGGTGTTVSVAFTGNATGGSAITGYTATSSPGGFTGTGASSPITVSGLTTGTAYTFTVTATNANGTSAASAASNSVTPVQPTAYYSIASATGVGTNSITFSSIPSTYKHLQLRFIGRSTTNSGGIDLIITYNGSTTGYASHWFEGGGSGTPSANYSTNPGAIYLGSALTGAITAANIFGTGIINISEYSSTSKTKTTYSNFGRDTNGAGFYSHHSNIWNNTSAINSITITTSSGNFVSGSNIALYGIKG